MSNQSAVETKNAASAAKDPVVTPEMMVEQLRALREQIPGYVQLAPADSKAIRTAASVQPEFAQAAINAIGASPTVQGVIGATPEELQQEAELTARWSKVEDELRAMLQGVSSAMLTRRHCIGNAALVTYALSKSLVRTPEHANLLPHVAVMRNANRTGRPRKSTAPAPVPVPKV